MELICEKTGIVIFDRVVSIIINQDDCPTRDQLDQLTRFPKLELVLFYRMDPVQLAREIKSTTLDTLFKTGLEDSSSQITVLTPRN